MTREDLEPDGDPELQDVLRQLESAASHERRLEALADAGEADPEFDALIHATVVGLAGRTDRHHRAARRWLGGLLAAAAAFLAWLLLFADGADPNEPSRGHGDDDRTLSGAGELRQVSVDGDLGSGVELEWEAPPGAVVTVVIFDPETGATVLRRDTLSRRWELTSDELQSVQEHHHWRIEFEGTRASSPLWP